VVNYSSFDDNFIVEVLIHGINQNAKTLLNGGTTTYFPIAVFETSEEASDFIPKFREKMNERKTNG
jgi:hypothetical protein